MQNEIVAVTLCSNCRWEYDRLVGQKITLSGNWLNQALLGKLLGRRDNLVVCPRCNNQFWVVEITENKLEQTPS